LNIKFTTKPNWPLLVLSGLLFIMVFLPWATVHYFGYSASANGFNNGGILTFLMSLAGATLSFLDIPVPKYKTYAMFGVGGLALLGVIIAFASLGGAGMGFGLILALIISILMIALAYFDLRGIDIMAKIKSSSTKSSPPPPPPPPPPDKS
jgi:peptidoglycan/LPS O-acetylase OafA/YrhL